MRIRQVLLTTLMTIFISFRVFAQVPQLATVYDFDRDSGPFFDPSQLVQGADGSFFGTAGGSGASGVGSGAVFKLTPAGELSVLHTFNGSDGLLPLGGVIIGQDGYLYGTTADGYDYG